MKYNSKKETLMILLYLFKIILIQCFHINEMARVAQNIYYLFRLPISLVLFFKDIYEISSNIKKNSHI